MKRGIWIAVAALLVAADESRGNDPRLQGMWACGKIDKPRAGGGREILEVQGGAILQVFDRDKVETIMFGKSVRKVRFQAFPVESPDAPGLGTINIMQAPELTYYGIYRVDGDSLMYCISRYGRPSSFDPGPLLSVEILFFRREKPRP